MPVVQQFNSQGQRSETGLDVAEIRQFTTSEELVSKQLSKDSFMNQTFKATLLYFANLQSFSFQFIIDIMRHQHTIIKCISFYSSLSFLWMGRILKSKLFNEEDAIEFGAEDIEEFDEFFTLTCSPNDFAGICSVWDFGQYLFSIFAM